MRIDTMLRALRKCERMRCPDYEPTCYQCTHYLKLADKLHRRIVQRFERYREIQDSIDATEKAYRKHCEDMGYGDPEY